MANVVIIGANRGIGIELTQQYCALGHRVIAVCRTTTTALQQLSCSVIEDIDVTQDSSIDTLHHTLTQALHGESIDIVIHNAGILQSDSFPEIDMQSMRDHFEVNTLGPLRTIIGLVSLLQKGSKIGIVSSRVGSIEDNSSSNNYAYRVSKTAVNMVGKCLSIDLAPQGIAVALLHPGYVRTDMTQGNGLIDADESAQGLIAQMDALEMSTTGCFVHSSGEQLVW